MAVCTVQHSRCLKAGWLSASRPRSRVASVNRLHAPFNKGLVQSRPKLSSSRICSLQASPVSIEAKRAREAETAKAQEEAREAAAAPVTQETASRNKSHLWFTQPEVPVAGAPLTLFFNSNCSDALRGCEGAPTLLMGFNGWSLRQHRQKLPMEPAELPAAAEGDAGGDHWWSATIPKVPDFATEANFVFSGNEGDVWENNNDSDFLHQVLGGPREDEGTMAVRELQGPDPNESVRIRVWTPPGFDPNNAPPGGYPVVYLNDGQNLFEDGLAFGGVSWRAGRAASCLIRTGRLRPFVIVGIDNRGVNRGWDYTPYPCGSGRDGFRGDAASWPGGGVWFYLQWLVDKVLPLAENEFGCSKEASKRVFGGSSLGGICGLCCAMKFSEVFDNILAESPSFWIGEGKFLEDLRSYSGKWPSKVFLAMGSQEYSGSRVHKEPKFDKWMVEYAEESKEILDKHQASKLMFEVEEGGAHNERDWARRLPGALEFLLGHTWDT